MATADLPHELRLYAMLRSKSLFVIPAKAGIQGHRTSLALGPCLRMDNDRIYPERKS
jgi:hypothetical protein